MTYGCKIVQFCAIFSGTPCVYKELIFRWYLVGLCIIQWRRRTAVYRARDIASACSVISLINVAEVSIKSREIGNNSRRVSSSHLLARACDVIVWRHRGGWYIAAVTTPMSCQFTAAAQRHQVARPSITARAKTRRQRPTRTNNSATVVDDRTAEGEYWIFGRIEMLIKLDRYWPSTVSLVRPVRPTVSGGRQTAKALSSRQLVDGLSMGVSGPCRAGRGGPDGVLTYCGTE